MSLPRVLADALRFASAPRGLLEHLATPADLDAAHDAALAAFNEGRRLGAELKRQADETAKWIADQTAHLRRTRAG